MVEKKTQISADLYALLMFAVMFAFICVIKYLPQENITIEILLLNVMFGILLVSYFFGTVAGLTLSIIFVFVYGSFMLYTAVVMGLPISMVSYAWIIAIPLVSIISSFFHKYINELQENINTLRKYVANYTGTDDKTGLPNVRMFYYELNRYMSISRRYALPVCLMVVKLRYMDEVRHLVGADKMHQLYGAIGETIATCTRTDDQEFIIDPDGVFSIILITDKPGADIVKERIKNKVYSVDYKKITSELRINVELKIGIAEYDQSVASPLELKELAVKDLEYDV